MSFASAAAPAEMRIKRCTKKTASGLGYHIVKPGRGLSPTDKDSVVVNYVGFFPTTRLTFDSGKKISFGVTDVVPGFSEGLKLMKPGARYSLCLPAALAYGAQGAGDVIPPNTDISFDVTLVEIKRQ